MTALAPARPLRQPMNDDPFSISVAREAFDFLGIRDDLAVDDEHRLIVRTANERRDPLHQPRDRIRRVALDLGLIE